MDKERVCFDNEWAEDDFSKADESKLTEEEVEEKRA